VQSSTNDLTRENIIRVTSGVLNRSHRDTLNGKKREPALCVYAKRKERLELILSKDVQVETKYEGKNRNEEHQVGDEAAHDI